MTFFIFVTRFFKVLMKVTEAYPYLWCFGSDKCCNVNFVNVEADDQNHWISNIVHFFEELKCFIGERGVYYTFNYLRVDMHGSHESQEKICVVVLFLRLFVIGFVDKSF